MLSKLLESLEGQEWFQQLKEKWEELDPQSRLYLKFGTGIAALLSILIVLVNFLWGVHKMKVELAEKNNLLHLLQSANQELQQLKEASSGSSLLTGGGGGVTDPWSNYFTLTAGTSGIAKENLSVSDERTGTATDLARESLIDLTLKHVNIRQLVRYTFALENGTRPIKLRNLQIDTKNDAPGYLDATLSISTFALQANK